MRTDAITIVHMTNEELLQRKSLANIGDGAGSISY